MSSRDPCPFERSLPTLNPNASHFQPTAVVRKRPQYDTAIPTANQIVEAGDTQDFLKKLQALKLETMGSTSALAANAKPPVASTDDQNKQSLPPHLRKRQNAVPASSVIKDSLNGGQENAAPQHQIAQSTKNALVMDGKVDTRADPLVETAVLRPAQPLTPPATAPSESTTTTFQPDIARNSIEEPYLVASGKGWQPNYITKLECADAALLSAIPSPDQMVSFSPDFLQNAIGGVTWSPGLIYVKPTPRSPQCILPNRSYWLLDFTVEPYLPRSPGHHGAKMTAFYNDGPVELEGSEINAAYVSTPMFVSFSPYASANNKKRYIYFGNYSQTRYSDKLDYDRMVEQVPFHIKQYWAEELGATGRAEWLTEALKNHFFPKPEYEGRLPGATAEGSVASIDEEKAQEGVVKDVKEYVELLRDWKRDAEIKTRLIRKDFILDAFERADADVPPALRLQWEYLEFDRWDEKLYDLLVTLQSREPGLYL